MVRTTQRSGHALVIGKVVTQANVAQNGADAMNEADDDRVVWSNHIYTLIVQWLAYQTGEREW